MKEEEITLLEIDACSRLPYGFKATDGNTEKLRYIKVMKKC